MKKGALTAVALALAVAGAVAYLVWPPSARTTHHPQRTSVTSRQSSTACNDRGITRCIRLGVTWPSSKQSPSVTVPKLIGLSGQAAAAKLDDLNLRYYADEHLLSKPRGVVQTTFPPRGYVASQSPSPETPLESGDTVLIVMDQPSISQSSATLSVPKLIGLRGQAAVAKLDGLGLRYSIDVHLLSKPKGVGLLFTYPPRGYVVSQSPPPGTPLEAGVSVGGGTVALVMGDRPR